MMKYLYVVAAVILVVLAIGEAANYVVGSKMGGDARCTPILNICPREK
jgi:hypothetical protein